MLFSHDHCCCTDLFIFFFFNDTATTEIYTLSLHDALPILVFHIGFERAHTFEKTWDQFQIPHFFSRTRSEEHTSELQSQFHLVCRLLLEKKNTISLES